MANFPHLTLVNRLQGTHKTSKRGGGDPNERTVANLNNKGQHGQALSTVTNSLSKDWTQQLEERKNKGLPELPDSKTIPIYLQIDSTIFNPEFLKGFGIEIISEEQEGYIIGASADGFKSLRDKINQFINENKAKNTSQLWQIVEGNIWRRDIILSKELNERWDQIKDTDVFILEIGVACYVKLSDEPLREKGETEARFNKRHATWLAKWRQQSEKRDELVDERTNLLAEFLKIYGGEILFEQFITFPDSFCCRIRINGVGLKDLVNNFQFVFEITESEDLAVLASANSHNEEIDVTITKPDNGSPEICVIDSGILEGHKLLNPAIISSKSKSYVPGDASVIDAVSGGGHGTKVAGAVLYSSTIPKIGETLKLPFFLVNARILDKNNCLSNDLYPPRLMEQICDDFVDTEIFNLSVTSWRPCRQTHMSQWASAIDKLIYERDLLFIIASGNISSDLGHITNPGIKHYLNNGVEYPNYLFQNASRIANPAQSSFALTVGSICHSQFEDLDRISFGKKGEASAFTRTGLGIWGMIKPEVVEFGGDYIVEKTGQRNISIHTEVAPELVKTGANGIGKDSVGTSFATPKVSHIAGILEKTFPMEPSYMYRALIVQSARHPNDLFKNPSLELIRTIGYGVPDLKRATENTKDRITFIKDDMLAAKQAHIYKVNIPNEVKRPGYDYDILIEVTLSYFANPRRTRKGTRSYVSTRLEWESAKLGESQIAFKDRVTKEMDEEEKPVVDGGDSIDWKIKNRIDKGVAGIRRQDSTIQKDWAIIKSNQLPDEFCIAIIGRKGWNTNITDEVPYALTISFEVLDSENEIELYQLVSAVNVQVEVEQQIQQPSLF